MGISQYARGGKEPNKDWWNLNTENDISLLKETLIKKFQFEVKDIKVLAFPQETTHKAIIEAFRTYLIAPTQSGDIVFFHFSGHGQQIPDDDADEIDGMDESLVPSDYISQQDGSKNIRDDELGALLDELKQKNPANVTVTLDSCYSGTATRGDLLPRGGPWKGAPIPKEKIRGEEASGSGLRERGGGAAEGYVFISAARPLQTAKETKNEADQPMGLFTWALIKAMEASGPTTTYRDIFEQLNDLMTRARADQNPQLEGELDKVLMAGTALKPAYVTILNLRSDRLVGPTRPQMISGVPPQVNDNLVNNDRKWRRIEEPYVFRVTGPTGLESFRAIATREPTDFTPLIDDRLLKRGDRGTARGKGAAKTTLGRILIARRQGKRGEMNMDVPPAWATATASFNVREK